MNEFRLIERIRKRISKEKISPSVVMGIGDDAAVIRTQGKNLLLVTMDTMVENIHFYSRGEDFFRIGYKAMASCISDIAAMGGNPKYALVSLGMSGDNLVENVDKLYKGFIKIGSKYNIDIIGGDTVESPRTSVVTLALLGEALPDRIISRKSAQVGDKLLVTGTFGDSGMGLDILRKKMKISNGHKKNARYLVNRHTMPEPRLKESGIITSKKLATSMIDASDGLDLSVKLICRESKKGARIWIDSVPLSQPLRTMSLNSPDRALRYALYGGEDYELVFTVPPERVDKTLREVGNATVIGEIAPPEHGIRYFDRNDRKVKINGKGYEHFTIPRR